MISQGNPFQQAVWEQLKRIPYGETRSYQYIANAISDPDGVRSVGAAIGANYKWTAVGAVDWVAYAAVA